MISGDWHLTLRKPERRMDDYIGAQKEKINQILWSAFEEGCAAILQPGDLCNSHDEIDRFKTVWIKLLKSSKREIFSVTGQHDLRYHTSPIDNTPYGVLTEGAGITIANDKPAVIGEDSSVHIYGASWEKKIPVIKDKDRFNILIIHRMITDDKLWPGQENYEIGGSFLRKHKFDLIVSGDNHRSFHYKHKNRWLINCGSLMRSNKDQINHEPCFWILDSEKREASQHQLSVEPFNEVMNLDVIKREEVKNKRLEALMNSLKGGSKLKGLKYEQRILDRVKELKKKNSISKLTEKIIEEVME